LAHFADILGNTFYVGHTLQVSVVDGVVGRVSSTRLGLSENDKLKVMFHCRAGTYKTKIKNPIWCLGKRQRSKEFLTRICILMTVAFLTWVAPFLLKSIALYIAFYIVLNHLETSFLTEVETPFPCLSHI